MRYDRRTGLAAVAAACAGVVVVAYCGVTAFRDVYDDAPGLIPVSSLTVRCDSAGRLCEAAVARLSSGRFHVRTLGPADQLTVTVVDPAAVRATRVLLVRTEGAGRLTIGTNTLPIQVPVAGAQGRVPRSVIPVPAAPWSAITFTPDSADRPAVLDEIGLYADDRGLLRSIRQPLPSIAGQRFYATYVTGLAFALCALIIGVAWREPVHVGRVGPWLIGVLCLAICTLEIGVMYSPYWGRDLRSLYGDELILTAHGGNLTGSLFEGARLVQGLGQTTAPGIVQWHRMPGYGWLCALAAILGRTTDVVEIAMLTVVLQIVLYSVAVGVFVAVARRVFGVPIACLLGILIALLPKQLLYTQVDSIIAPIALLVLSTLLVYLERAGDDGSAPLWVFLLINVAFASWFVMRNDVLVGWLVVSVALAGRRWRRLVVPFALILAIALPWAVYKQQYRHEFDFLPTNTGEVLFLSLCEVRGAFPYECTDAGHYAWMLNLGHRDAVTQRASNLAAKEVVRHWATYPVHFGFMVWVKVQRALLGESWPGFKTRLSLPYVGGTGLFAFLLTVLIISLAVNHQRRRSLLLGWALFLNMPLFFFVFASMGRFNTAAGISLLVASVPLLFERDLYLQMRRHRWRAVAVIVAMLLFVAEGHRVEQAVGGNDALHYWAPLLDPAHSSLRFVGH